MLANKAVHTTIWVVEHVNPNLRESTLGQPVPANAPVVIKHCATGSALASDYVDYRNEFGSEYEVCVHNFVTGNKSQNLALENKGLITGTASTKFSFD
jgi:hypothetical protein